jgi:hypothetical protein
VWRISDASLFVVWVRCESVDLIVTYKYVRIGAGVAGLEHSISNRKICNSVHSDHYTTCKSICGTAVSALSIDFHVSRQLAVAEPDNYLQPRLIKLVEMNFQIVYAHKSRDI